MNVYVCVDMNVLERVFACAFLCVRTCELIRAKISCIGIERKQPKIQKVLILCLKVV